MLHALLRADYTLLSKRSHLSQSPKELLDISIVRISETAETFQQVKSVNLSHPSVQSTLHLKS